jgi:hypothetical protein
VIYEGQKRGRHVEAIPLEQLGLSHLTDPVQEFGPQMPHYPTIVDFRTPAAEDQDGPLARENGPVQGISTNEPAAAADKLDTQPQ